MNLELSNEERELLKEACYGRSRYAAAVWRDFRTAEKFSKLGRKLAVA